MADRLREVLTDDKLGKFKFDEIVRQAEHDLGLKQVIRADEMARLAERFSFERNREGVVRRIEVAGIENDHAREQAWKELDARERQADETHRHDLQRQLAVAQGELDQRKIRVELERLDHAERLRQREERARSETVVRKTRLEAERAEHDEKVRRTEAALGLQKQLWANEADAEERQLRSRAGADVAALLSVVGGSEAQRILELEKLRIRKGMTAEQMLAMAAEASPEAAAALRIRYSQDAAKERLEEQQRSSDTHADRMATLMGTAMNQMGNVATAKADSSGTKPTIVTGVGQPTVIGVSSLAPALCKFCGAVVGPSQSFCGVCGKALA